MDRDTEKSMQEKVLKKPPIYKHKLFIAGSIVITALLGAVIFSVIFGKHHCVPFEFFEWLIGKPCNITYHLTMLQKLSKCEVKA